MRISDFEIAPPRQPNSYADDYSGPNYEKPMTGEQPRELGCLAEGAIIAAVYIIIFWVLIPLVFGVRINGTIPIVIAAAIVGWFLTRRYRKKLEKRLGRKLKGDHELTSISSWMEASQKDERPRVTNDEEQKPRN